MNSNEKENEWIRLPDNIRPAAITMLVLSTIMWWSILTKSEINIVLYLVEVVAGIGILCLKKWGVELLYYRCTLLFACFFLYAVFDDPDRLLNRNIQTCLLSVSLDALTLSFIHMRMWYKERAMRHERELIGEINHDKVD